MTCLDSRQTTAVRHGRWEQYEIDCNWEKLSKVGDETAQQCGWLKDRFGVSWQIHPTLIGELMSDPSPGRYRKAMKALLAMKKIDVETLKVPAGKQEAA